MTQTEEIAAALASDLQQRGYYAHYTGDKCVMVWKDYTGDTLDTTIWVRPTFLEILDQAGQPHQRIELCDPEMIDKIVAYMGPPDA